MEMLMNMEVVSMLMEVQVFHLEHVLHLNELVFGLNISSQQLQLKLDYLFLTVPLCQ